MLIYIIIIVYIGIKSRKGENNMKNDYGYQKEANIECLLKDIKYSERKETLFKLVLAFEKARIRWGLAFSMNLYLHGITDEFHDLDLIVEYEDIPRIKNILQKMGGTLIATGGNGFCESVSYMHYQLGRVDVDVIAGFRILTYGTEFLYNYNERELEYVKVSTFNIPLIPIEALYILYFMMEGWQSKRRYKRLLISEYLVDNLEFPEILENSLEAELPHWIKKQIKLLLQQ